MLNDRPVSLVVRGALQPSNYVGLGRMPWVYERPLLAASRFFLGKGTYPCSMRVRTPLGPQEITLFNSYDAMTVHEIFCRQVYRSLKAPEVVVDVGSNVGISALYFLTRSPSVYCDLYEPDPRNVVRLLRNLKLFEGRFTLHESAVYDRDGVLTFLREPSGRYGSLKTTTWLGPSPDKRLEIDRINVRVEHINGVLERAMSRLGRVDLLKIDSEGCEVDTVRAIDRSLLKRVAQIVIDGAERSVQIDGFDASPAWDTTTFSNRSLIV